MKTFTLFLVCFLFFNTVKSQDKENSYLLKDLLKFNPKLAISTMPFRYIWRRPNANLEFQMNRMFAFEIGVDHKPDKAPFWNSKYYTTGTKYHFGTTLSLPTTEKFSILLQFSLLHGVINDYTSYKAYYFSPYPSIQDTIVTFNTTGFSTGIGFEVRPVAGLFIRLNLCLQYLPYKQKVEKITNYDREWDNRPTSESWKFPLTLGGIADLQFSLGYRFGLKKK